MAERLIRSGLVAVLYSPGHGAGWSTWCHSDDQTQTAMMFDPVIADLRDSGDADWLEKVLNVASVKYPDQYHGGLRDIEVAWLPQGTNFRIREYDGSEYIELKDQVQWVQA